MARKQFTHEQIVAILREAERGVERPTLFRTHRICEQPFYRWKRMYGGLGVSEVRRIKELEDENRTLKQLAGEQALVIETMKRKCRSNGGGFNCATQSALVELLRVQGLSQGRACSSLGISRSKLRYRPKPEPPVNMVIRQELHRLAARHRRYGTPRMTALVRREGYWVNHKRLERLCKLEGVPLSRKRPRKHTPRSADIERLPA